MINIVGLGTEKGDLTERGKQAICGADTVYLKTERHPARDYIVKAAKNVVFLDSVYEEAEDFESLNETIAERVLNDANENVVYCVPGSGLGDRSVALLQDKTEVSFLPGVADAATDIFVAKATEYTILSATEFCERKKNLFDTNLALVLTELNDPYLAADVKLKLLGLYGAEHPVIFQGNLSTVAELDRKKEFNDKTNLVVPPLPLVEKERYTFGDLIEVIYRLRDPDGCQWDRAQTHRTIRGNAIEEAYELVEAIDLDDVDKMREESGDVVLQGLFNAVIADSLGEFDVNDMITELTRKLITRHTHIFGENKANNTEEALAFWEAAKAKEKGYNSVSDKFDSVPKTFGALMYANKLQKYASKAGYDFKDAESAAPKVAEEIAEFFAESDPEKKETEGGDILFAAMNLLRLSGIDPEVALRRSAAKFRVRVEKAAELLDAKGIAFKDLSENETDRLWEDVKKILSATSAASAEPVLNRESSESDNDIRQGKNLRSETETNRDGKSEDRN